MNTDCSKCGAPMPVVPKANPASGIMSALKFVLTGFVCQKCGKANHLERRKGFKQWSDNQ